MMDSHVFNLAGGGRYLCPVDDCDWFTDVPEPRIVHTGTTTVVRGFEHGVLERMCKEHLATHGSCDFFLTTAGVKVVEERAT